MSKGGKIFSLLFLIESQRVEIFKANLKKAAISTSEIKLSQLIVWTKEKYIQVHYEMSHILIQLETGCGNARF